MTANQNAGLLHDAIAAVCPIAGVSVAVWGNPATVTIQYDPSATAEQKTAAEAALQAFDWTDFAGYQASAQAAIDAKTQALLAAGFSYTNAGGTGRFDLSLTSQPSWLAVMIAAAGLTYPFQVATIGGTLFALLSAADVAAWFTAGMTRGQTILTGGVMLKTAIAAQATTAGVDAVVDART